MSPLSFLELTLVEFELVNGVISEIFPFIKYIKLTKALP